MATTDYFWAEKISPYRLDSQRPGDPDGPVLTIKDLRMNCQLHLSLVVYLFIINFKLASLATNLNLNINDMLPGEGERSNDILKVTKDKGSNLVTLKDKDSAWLNPNLNVFSWPGKRASRSDATSKDGLNSRSQLIWDRNNFTVYIAVYNKTSPSKTR